MVIKIVGMIALMIAVIILVVDFCINLYGFIKSAFMGYRDVYRYANHLMIHVFIWGLVAIVIVIGG